MKIIYAPADGPVREFTFRPEQLLSFDSEPLEEAGGDVWSDWDGFREALYARKGRALRAALWHDMKREKPGLQFAHVVVKRDEMMGLWEDYEIAQLRAVAANPDTDDDVREGIWAAVGKGDAEDPSASSESDTSAPSPDTDSA